MAGRPLFLVLYFLSGLAGLLYQVTWSRLLALHMGHNLAALSTVLAAFMGGLATGSALAGRWTPRLTDVAALRLYGWLELAAAALALLVAPALHALGPLLTRAYSDGDGGVWFGFVRAATSLLLVFIPAAAMGGTFPAAVRWFAGAAADAAPRAGRLYAVNTLGAAAGAAAAGFALIPALGLTRTTAAGVALNVAVAAGAFRLAGRAARRDRVARPADAVPAAPKGSRARSGRVRSMRDAAFPPALVPRSGAPLWLVSAALALSGFVGLTLEVAWTRTLALVIGPTTQAFSLMLSVFIAGLGAGALVGARVARRLSSPLTALGVSLLATSASAGLFNWLIDRVPLTVAARVADASATYGGVLMTQAGLAAALLLPAAAALGAAFPLALSAATARHSRLSRDASLIYAANTAGAIAGSLAAGFVLIPALGLQVTAVLAATLAAVAGLAVLLAARPGRTALFAGVTAATLLGAAGWMLPDWNRAMMSGGAYKHSNQVHGADLQAGLEAGRLVYYGEGAGGTVSVRVVAGATSLAIDGKVDASDAGDMLTQMLLAHLPLLLHPQPRQVAIIGLGSGVTLGAALRHPIARADTLEISPEVVEASASFAHVNGRPLDDPRSRLIVGDGRTHLLRGTRRYDVIISEPSNPWMAGLATLFTRDFFLAARARLAEEGLFCQWAHTYDISDADLRSIVATFTSVFPDGTVWFLGDADLLLIGGLAPVEPRLAGIQRAWERPGVAEDLARAGVQDPFSVLSLFGGTRDLLTAYGAGAPIQTDDHMPLEFSAPASALGGAAAADPPGLRGLAADYPLPPQVAAALASASPAEWRNRGTMLLRAHAYQPAYDAFARAVHGAPGDGVALAGLVRAAVPAGREEEAIQRLREVIAADPANVPARVEASSLLASRGADEDALRVLADPAAASTTAGRAQLLAQAASIFADAADAARLGPAVRALERERPDAGITLFYMATERYLLGQAEEAARLAELAVARLPEARVHNLLGAALAALGRTDRARQAFSAAAAADPSDPAGYVNLGVFELERADARAAAAHFAEALSLDPGSDAAREGLASAFERLGENDRAARVRRSQAASPRR